MYGLSVMRVAELARSYFDRRLAPKGRSGETGAIAVIVGIVVAYGMLLGLGAIVIDTGSLLSERSQLQSGADAAALSVGKTCATAPLSAPCTLSGILSGSTLADLAGKNALDQKSDIASVCASAALISANPNAGFAACTNWLANPSPPDPGLVECPRTFNTGNYVEVRTSTRTASGANFVPPVLSQMLAGATSQNSAITVKACSRATWGSGYPLDQTVGVTDALCAWTAATNNTPAFPDMPPYSPPPDGSPLGAVPVASKYVVKVLLQGGGGTTDPATCGKTVSGQYTSGQFGWLDVKSGTDCTANISSDGQSVGGNTGASGGTCNSYLAGKIGTIIYIPIFTSVTGTGQNAIYKIDGVSAFFLAGFQAPGVSGSNIPTPAYDAYNTSNPTVHCVAKNDSKIPETKDDGCLWGWYLSPLVPNGSGTTGTPRGPIIIGVGG
jgi:hypothetical protein